MKYEEFEKACLKRLIEERKSSDPADLKKYINESDSQEILHQFFDEGLERYKNGTKHDENIAFSYCIETAVVNLSLLY